MPVSYRYDPKANAVITSTTGILKINEIVAYFERVYRDPEVAPEFVEVVLFDEALDFAFRYTETALVFDAYSRFMLAKRCVRTVFVAKTPLGFGIARMFSTSFGEHGDLRVVRTEDELNKELSDIRGDTVSIKA